MIGWLLNLVYAGLFFLSLPWLLFRMVVQGKNRTGWGEKFFGKGPVRTSTGPAVWFHAVSVGEVLLLRTILPAYRIMRPHTEIWISTTTHTGHAVAREKYPNCQVIYYPFDFTWSVRAALARVRPTMIVLVELELWPNFIRTAAALQIPIVLINGRMSARSFCGYQRVRWLVSGLLQRLTKLAVQTEEYGQRLMALGAPPERVIVTGSTKYDGLETRRDNPRTEEIRRLFGIGDHETVFIAGSTQAPEEQFALATYQALRPQFEQLRLVLVPRHQERFEEVTALIQSRGLPLLRRTEVRQRDQNRLTNEADGNVCSTDKSPVLLLDTLGELAACWGLADIAFVGGSLTNRGGQNMIEPAAYGAAVLFGPNTGNFRQVVELLLGVNAALIVRTSEELTATVRRLLKNPEETRRLGDQAKAILLPQQGATGRTIKILLAVSNAQNDRRGP